MIIIFSLVAIAFIGVFITLIFLIKSVSLLNKRVKTADEYILELMKSRNEQYDFNNKLIQYLLKQQNPSNEIKIPMTVVGKC
jgi:hypothetical protein